MNPDEDQLPDPDNVEDLLDRLRDEITKQCGDHGVPSHSKRKMLALCDSTRDAVARRSPQQSASLPPIGSGKTLESFRREPVVPAVSLGSAIGASLYLVLESMLQRTNAERLSMYMTNQRSELQFVTAVGIGMSRLRKNPPTPSAQGVLRTVMSTGIAINMPTVTMEDVVDCQGTTKGRNVLVFPIRSRDEHATCIGGVVLVNKKRGTERFNEDDEKLCHAMNPTLAYVAQTYPIDYAAFGFDPAPMHRIIPMEHYVPSHAQLPPGWNVPQTQLVYHSEGPEKFIRRNARDVREHMQAEAAEIAEEGTTFHLRSIETYLQMMESCWRDAIVQGMDAERQLKQKQSLIVDAQEILHRKQRKLDLVKDVLCEQLQRTSGGNVPMMVAKPPPEAEKSRQQRLR
jgi:hypothetical protein